MLGLVRSVKSIYDLVEYMHEKIQQDKARTIYADNFIKDAHELTMDDILSRFRLRHTLNQRVGLPMKHFIITFDPTDSLTDDVMADLAKKYIAGAGYENQPFVIYRHLDTAHPHAHAISTQIREDGTRIDLGPPQVKRLHKLTKELEIAYGLKPSHTARGDELEGFKVRQAQRVGRTGVGLKKSISDVLNTVVDFYVYTSLEELNAILRQYNVKADGGKEGTRLNDHRGMVYYALNSEGEQISRGIKASLFSLKPTRDYLEKRFQINQPLQQDSRQRIRTAIDWTIAIKNPDREGLQEALKWEGIAMVLQDSKDGKGKETYFIDHRDRSAVSAHSLGSQYGLQALQERTVQQQRMDTEEIQRQHIKLRL